MAGPMRAITLAGLSIVLTSLAAPTSAQRSTEGLAASAEAAPAAALPAPTSDDLERFSGIWVYNEEESLNAATGRPERSPRSATQRAPLGRGGATAPSAPPRPPVVPQPGRTGLGPALTGLSGQIGPTVAMIQENRSLARDLLEIPESLAITATPGAVTFTDDLERVRVYQTDGQRSRYQLGAARFNAAAEWNGTQFVKRIDGSDGFRMTETYFLSEDGRRLFIIVRVGSNRKNAPVMGVNRVYDRAGE